MHGFVTAVVMIGLLVSLVGLIFKLPIFGHRRLVALGVLVLLGTGGIKLSDALRSPEQVAADDAATKLLEANMAAGYDDVEANPEDYIGVETSFNIGFGSADVQGTLTNRSNFPILNVRLRCDQFGETNKRLERESVMIAKTVPAGQSVEFGPVSIGSANSQTVAVYCQATDADALPGT